MTLTIILLLFMQVTMVHGSIMVNGVDPLVHSERGKVPCGRVSEVPCIMRWPEIISPGQSISNIASTIDIYPTIANILDDKIERYANDGVSLLPLLNGEKNSNPRNELYYYYGEKLIAVRKGKWKLVFPHVYRSYKGVEPEKPSSGPYNKSNPD